VSGHGYALVDKRLFIPEQWFADEYFDRRQKCKLPADAVFRTKPELAVEMLNAISKEDVLPFKYVLADSIYGVSPDFIGAAEALPGKTYFVSVPKDTLCWLSGLRWAIEQCFEETKTELGRHGSPRSALIPRMAAPYANVHAGTFLPLAPEDQIGGKKYHPILCRSLDCCSRSFCR